MIPFEDCFVGASGGASLPKLYVYSFGPESRRARYLRFTIDLDKIVIELNDVITMLRFVQGHAACVDEVVAELADLNQRYVSRLFHRPSPEHTTRVHLEAAACATATVLAELTSTIGPLIFSSHRGEALLDV